MVTDSSVLFIGHPEPLRMDIGAAVAADFAAARAIIRQRPPAVVVLPVHNPNDLRDFCAFLKSETPQSLWVLVGEGLAPRQIIEMANDGTLVDIVAGFDDPTLIDVLKRGLELSGERTQSQELARLVADQSQDLIRLKHELETRIERRQKALRKSRHTLDSTKLRLEAFHRALIGVHRAKTVLDREQALNASLGTTLPGMNVRVRFANQTAPVQTPGHSTLTVEIPLPNGNLSGEALFTMPDGHRFSAAETDFLHEITEALALALSRLNAFELEATVKTQWQATFDSIPHPLCLCTADYEIVKLNLAFQQACPRLGFRELIGKNCFEIFLGPGFKPPATLPFRASRAGPQGQEHFEVSGENMGLTHDGHAVRLLMFRPVTDEVRYERRILEASKLAELGTIGSSIAHELNNPLGGMLSFLQLILMDIKPDHPIFSDVKSMEEATLRCRDIVQNLLSFARKQDLGQFTDIELWDAVDKAVKLIELQSKARGISIDQARGAPALVTGSENALIQALCNILQNGIDAIGERLTRDPLYPGRIQISLSEHEGKIQLRIADNGTGIRPEVQSRIFNPLFTTRDPGLYSGMGLTSAFSIISEHHGSLEILSQTGSGTTAIIALPSARKTAF